ncbi:uncharacterized protein JCM15063_001720 [Sporobolomyces koalae]|uniref:uncharacterized protein n=1 Tax=Sporobolomyces koalae TaxID=500713 RepID=UPI003179D24E
MPQRVQYRTRGPAGAPAGGTAPPVDLVQLGTVLYRGPVPPTTGEWLGIEWDDPTRGRHSGTHDKTRVEYFRTRIEGSGSFLRPNAPGLIVSGNTFQEAFEAKYLDAGTNAESSQDTVDDQTTTSQYYETLSNFKVEVVMSGKVAARFRQLARLREAGLEWELLSRAYDSDTCDGAQELETFGRQLSGLDDLNLSYTMLPSLQEASRIAQALPKLTRLSLNSNRFDSICEHVSLPGFDRLTILKLNNTLVTWSEILRISPSLQNLVELQLGSNRISLLVPASDSAPAGPLLPRLETLNFESNQLADWEQTAQALSDLPNLTTLILTSNSFERFDSNNPDRIQAPFQLRKLRHLSLSRNLFASWSNSIDVLGATASERFPNLSSLDFACNPLGVTNLSNQTSGATDLQVRFGTIAKLERLEILDGNVVTSAEREDAERSWLARVQNSITGNEGHEHLGDWATRRFQALTKKYSTSENSVLADPKSTKNLKSRLIRLRICTTAPIEHEGKVDDLDPPPLELSVVPTLRIVVLRSQISRSKNEPLPKSKFRFVGWTRTKEANGEDDGPHPCWLKIEIPTKDEGRDLNWWGLEDQDWVQIVPNA